MFQDRMMTLSHVNAIRITGPLRWEPILMFPLLLHRNCFKQSSL